jgi:anti-sigma factor RsiW
MAERTFNSSSPACGQWETLLADALDGQLKPGDEAVFTAHMAVCPACAALFDDARRGREWLDFLSTEPEVPAGLLDKILARTGPGQVEGYTLAAGSGSALPMPSRSAPVFIPAWQRPGFVGSVRRFAEPRLLMTAAMAFFSISVTLSVTNVRLSNLHLANLRPAAVRSFMERRLTMASTPIIRYYDHSHFVYEVQSGMRELRRATQVEGEENDNRQKPNETAPGESKQSPTRKDGGSPLEAPQQSGNPATGPVLGPAGDDSTGFYETSLTPTSPALQAWPALSGGSATRVRERSTVWIA